MARFMDKLTLGNTPSGKIKRILNIVFHLLNISSREIARQAAAVDPIPLGLA
jgi:hypothetical protein